MPAAGFFASGTLTLAHWFGAPLPCGTSRGCDVIAASPLAYVGGIPIALFGAVAFLVLAWLAAPCVDPLARMNWVLGYILSGAVTLISVFLTIFSRLSLQATCRWCVASALCFCLTCLLYAFRSILGASWMEFPERRRLGGGLIGAALAIAGAAVPVQLYLTSLVQPPYDPLVVAAVSLAELTPSSAPSLGDPKGGLVLIFFGDLQCDACRHALPILAGAVRTTRGTQLVFRNLPQWYHEYALEAAVYAERSKSTVGFWNFVSKLGSTEGPLTLSQLRAVEKWAKLSSLDARTDSSLNECRRQVLSDLQLGKKLGISSTPSILVIEGPHRSVLNFRAALARVRTYR